MYALIVPNNTTNEGSGRVSETLYVAEPGARTIREARDMKVDGQRVTAERSASGTVIFVGLEIVHTTSEQMTMAEVQLWAVAYRDALESAPAVGEPHGLTSCYWAAYPKGHEGRGWQHQEGCSQYFSSPDSHSWCGRL